MFQRRVRRFLPRAGGSFSPLEGERGGKTSERVPNGTRSDLKTHWREAAARQQRNRKCKKTLAHSNVRRDRLGGKQLRHLLARTEVTGSDPRGQL
ncbi:unnamed protein product [Lampetra planeri]